MHTFTIKFCDDKKFSLKIVEYFKATCCNFFPNSPEFMLENTSSVHVHDKSMDSLINISFHGCIWQCTDFLLTYLKGNQFNCLKTSWNNEFSIKWFPTKTLSLKSTESAS